MLPYVNSFRPIHNLASMADLCPALSGPDGAFDSRKDRLLAVRVNAAALRSGPGRATFSQHVRITGRAWTCRRRIRGIMRAIIGCGASAAFPIFSSGGACGHQRGDPPAGGGGLRSRSYCCCNRATTSPFIGPSRTIGAAMPS